MLVARPLAVWLSTLRSDLDFRKRVLLAGVAPRGIVAASIASVLGLGLEAAEIPGAELITPVAFAVIVASVLLYGPGAGRLARRLGEASANQEGVLVLGAGPVERAIATTLPDAGLDVAVATVNRRDEVGCFFAVTPNDEVNTLAARRFKSLSGRGETYQLPPPESPDGVGNGATVDLGGRLIFREDATYERLRTLLGRHAVNMTPLTSDFSFDAFGNDAMLLFALRDRQLLIAATDTPNPLESRLQPGDQVFWLTESCDSR